MAWLPPVLAFTALQTGQGGEGAVFVLEEFFREFFLPADWLPLAADCGLVRCFWGATLVKLLVLSINLKVEKSRQF